MVMIAWDDGPHDGWDREPSAADLAAIEAEWPWIKLDLAELDAEIAEIVAGPAGAALAWRRYRRLQQRLLGAVRVVAGRGAVAA